MKETTVTCDRCRMARLQGMNWSGVWAKAKRIGWVLGEDRNVHYCPKCAKEVQGCGG